ncbi:MAG: hypothetical protein ACOX2F_04425 [bacterium]
MLGILLWVIAIIVVLALAYAILEFVVKSAGKALMYILGTATVVLIIIFFGPSLLVGWTASKIFKFNKSRKFATYIALFLPLIAFFQKINYSFTTEKLFTWYLIPYLLIFVFSKGLLSLRNKRLALKSDKDLNLVAKTYEEFTEESFIRNFFANQTLLFIPLIIGVLGPPPDGVYIAYISFSIGFQLYIFADTDGTWNQLTKFNTVLLKEVKLNATDYLKKHVNSAKGSVDFKQEEDLPEGELLFYGLASKYIKNGKLKEINLNNNIWYFDSEFWNESYSKLDELTSEQTTITDLELQALVKGTFELSERDSSDLASRYLEFGEPYNFEDDQYFVNYSNSSVGAK